MGEAENGAKRLEFRGAKVTTDAGLLVIRKLDEVLGLADIATCMLSEARAGNRRHDLAGLFRQPGWQAMKTSTTRKRYLVHRPSRFFTLIHLSKYSICTLGPDEDSGIFVVVFYELHDGIDKLGHAFECAPPDPLVGNLAEESLHHV